jgi:hypothetical protein
VAKARAISATRARRDGAASRSPREAFIAGVEAFIAGDEA